MASKRLIPRKALFGNPTRQTPLLSPDGRHLAWLAPFEGVMNVWVAPREDIAAARALTREPLRPIQSYFWSPASDRILFFADVGGTEDFLLYSAALGGGDPVCVTPFPKTRVQVVKISHEVKDRILLGINSRDPRWHDTYSLDLASGALTLVWENPGGLEGVVADRQLMQRLVTRATDAGGSILERFEADGSLTPLLEIGLADSRTTAILGFTQDGGVLVMDSRGRDKVALTKVNPETGETEVLAEDDQADVQYVLRNAETGEAEAVGVDYLKLEWRALGHALEEDIAFLNAAFAGTWRRLNQSDDGRFWTIMADDGGASVSDYWLYEREGRALSRLFSTRSDLEAETLSVMRPVEIPARDGLTLVSYLTLPAGEGSNPAKPLPLVLSVHGGPWGRDVFGANATHLWLADRGYAVLSVNYRASTGFGKAFVNAGDLQWGRAMHDDLLDAVKWAVDAGIADPAKVAIMGGSYGGYATLVGMTMTPDVFCCGVDIVGPSNLFTLLSTIPPYWQGVFLQFAHRMGDPRTEEGRALLKERSPVTYVDRIKKPLLIGQGANDPRVNQAESDQIVQAMKAKNIPVTYVLYPDEGHGFARPENRLSFWAITEAFLAENLGGECEPVGDDFEGSSLQVPEGAAHVRGLGALANA